MAQAVSIKSCVCGSCTRTIRPIHLEEPQKSKKFGLTQVSTHKCPSCGAEGLVVCIVDAHGKSNWLKHPSELF